MAKIYQRIEVEVSKPNFFSAIVAKQYDRNSRYLIATLKHCGEVVEIPTGSTVLINAKRSDGKEIFDYGNANVDGMNTVTVPLTYDMLAVEGSVECDISIKDGEESTLSTTTFYLEVEGASYDINGTTGDEEEDVTENENYATLVKLIDDVNKVKPDLAYNPESENAQSGKAVAQAIAGKQDVLISAENIKTINGESILGSGDINTVGAGAEKVRWCAMGDSITQGAYSFYEEGKTPVPGVIDKYGTTDEEKSLYKWDLIQSQNGNTGYDYVNSWVPKLAKMKNWNFTSSDNKGIGNTGWAYKKTAGLKMAWEVADETDFKQYDIVTLMYGVNDWSGGINRGSISDAFNAADTPETIVAGMRRTIEKIIEDNPHCKIIVITPLNRRGTYSETRWLKESDNWALGFSKGTDVGTLEDVFGTIKSVCEYYGIEMIDMTHTSIANRHNLPFVLPDYVHPTPEAHTAIARELSAKINFN